MAGANSGDLGSLIFDIDVNTKRLDQAEKDIKRLASNGSKGFNKLSGAVNVFTTAIAGFLTLQTAKKVIDIADSYGVLTDRIKSASAATGDFDKVMLSLQATSLETGVSLKTNVSTFQAISRGAREVGASTADILKLTEVVDQLGIIGGSSQQQLGNGLLQFSQALSGGILRAEEFNSIIENTPEIGNRLAKGLGLSVGQLRNAVLEGEILSSDIFGSLLKQSEEINAEFEAIPQRLTRATARLSTAFQIAVGESGSLSKVMQSLIDNTIIFGDALIDPWGTLEAAIAESEQVALRFINNFEQGFVIAIGNIRKSFLDFTIALDSKLRKIPFAPKLDLSEVDKAKREIDKRISGARSIKASFNVESFKKSVEIAKEREESLQAALDGSSKASVDRTRKELTEKDALNEGFFAKQKERNKLLLEAAQSGPFQDINALIEELEKASFESRLETLTEFHEGVLRAQQAFNTARADLSGQEVDNAEDNFRRMLGQASSSSKTLFNLQKGLALADIAIKTPQAIADGFTYGNSIGGPPLGVVFGGVAGASMAVQGAQIQSANFSSMQSGGDIMPNSTARVNERGPELLTVGKDQFLMTGNAGGHITPNNKLGTLSNNSGSTTINIVNLPGQTASENRSRDGSGNETITLEIIDAQISKGILEGTSQVSRAMENQFGSNRGIKAPL